MQYMLFQEHAELQNFDREFTFLSALCRLELRDSEKDRNHLYVLS